METSQINRRSSLLCLDVPKGTSFGIDFHVFQCGERFKGIKLIPPGLHFIFYNSVNKEGGEGAPKTSFFKWFEPGEVLVTRWNTETEDLDFVEEEEANRYREGVNHYEFDSNLGPYSETRYNEWTHFSSLISKEVLSKLEPIKKKISSIYEGLETEQEKELLKDISTQTMNETHSFKPFYSTIPQSRKPSKKSSAEEITNYNMDKSGMLKQLLTNYPKDSMGLIGELQFSFICFLCGESFDGFDQWKELIKIITQCDSAIQEIPQFFVQFTLVFLQQLKEFPEDFFENEITENNFMAHCLSQYLQVLNDPSSQISPSLKKESKKLEVYVQKRFGKKIFDSFQPFVEEGEDAPTIVEINDVY